MKYAEVDLLSKNRNYNYISTMINTKIKYYTAKAVVFFKLTAVHLRTSSFIPVQIHIKKRSASLDEGERGINLLEIHQLLHYSFF